MKRNILKFEVTTKDDGKIKVIPYSNRQLGILTSFLNQGIQDVVKQLNHEADWEKKYICFGHNGNFYRQVDKLFGTVPCFGCVFDEHGCTHPHYSDGTKGNCEDKIYIEEQWKINTQKNK